MRRTAYTLLFTFMVEIISAVYIVAVLIWQIKVACCVTV